MIRLLITILVSSAFLNLAAQSTTYSLQTGTAVNYTNLKESFQNPPPESRLRCYWWWLNSMATKESITRDLEEMKAKGYGGASIVDAGSSNYQVALKTAAGPVFMSPGWMVLYKHAVKEAQRVGIELSVNVQSGWNPGGPSITPEYALKKLVYTETEIKGGGLVVAELPQPETKLLYHDVKIQAIRKSVRDLPVKDEAITNWSKKSFNQPMGWQGIYPLHELRQGFDNPVDVNIIKKEEILDITDRFDGKQLRWEAPAGDWVVIRYGYTCTGARTSTNSDGWEGLSLDHLSPEAFQLFSSTVIQPLIDSAKSAGNSVRFLQTDSWEMGVVSWTNNFPAEFKRLRGYEIDPYLPVLAGRVVESQEVSNRFLHDFRKTVGDCVAENHYQLFYNLAHENGMGIHPESGGPHSAPVDALKVMGISDFPQGEFWAMSNTHRITDAARLAVKQSACVAHINGKRFVAAEGPTSIGPQWERPPRELKSNLDRIFCSGVNRIVWHTFTSSPKEFGLPGNEYFAGTHLNPNVTWWKQAGDFISYLNRCSYMLQQGVFVADVLYYYGDDVPNFVFLKEEFPELNFGYDWDKCSKDVILNRLSVDKGNIILPDGMSYRVLMLPPDRAIDLEVLRKVEKLVSDGMTLIGPKPSKATGLENYPACDAEIAAIAERLWGNMDGKSVTENPYGKGKVIWGQNINEVLTKMQVVPDFSFKGNHAKTSLDYIHRTTNDQEIYFVANRFSRMEFNDFTYRYLTTLPDRYEQTECRFRITGKVPEIWNPVTGETTEVLTYREENGQTVIPLHFEPDGSKFIVFRKAKQDRHIIEIRKDNKSIFPSFRFETGHFPYIDVVKKDGKISSDCYIPGIYQLTWSDGKTDKIKLEKHLPEIDLSEGWNLSFDPVRGPDESIKVHELKSWIHFDNPEIKYYSGTATYTKLFTIDKLPANCRMILDLGNVLEMASIQINGRKMPVRWSAPFLFDITSFLKSGVNLLEVEVVNMWPNRLIGDGKLPAEQRLTRTNVVKFNGPDADQYLRESGLLGPVKIMLVPVIALK
jgi:hypothetical protein